MSSGNRRQFGHQQRRGAAGHQEQCDEREGDAQRVIGSSFWGRRYFLRIQVRVFRPQPLGLRRFQEVIVGSDEG